MSALLDPAARLDPQRASDLDRTDVEMRTNAHLHPIESATEYAQRRARENDAQALKLDLQMRDVGLLR